MRHETLPMHIAAVPEKPTLSLAGGLEIPLVGKIICRFATMENSTHAQAQSELEAGHQS